jgi:hypothetical protein
VAFPRPVVTKMAILEVVPPKDQGIRKGSVERSLNWWVLSLNIVLKYNMEN